MWYSGQGIIPSSHNVEYYADWYMEWMSTSTDVP